MLNHDPAGAVLAAVGTNSRALWYMTRGFGLVALVLLTMTMVLGLMQSVRFVSPAFPRFVVSALHRNVSLLAVAVLAVHIATAVLDSFAPVHLVDAFVPFVSKYRPIWLGLGALALDLLIALIVTSLLRDRMGHSTWRVIHWTAYACWPVAVVHGLGTGTDAKLGWVLLLDAVCAVAVLVALWWRLAQGWSVSNASGRGVAVLASVVLPVGIALWTVTGPLRSGWARRAGTPASLLHSGSSSPSATASTTVPPAGNGAAGLSVPFTAGFQGTQSQSGPDASGLVSINITGQLSGGAAGDLAIVLTGEPAGGGGVTLTGSQVYLGTSADPKQYSGHVTQLQGGSLLAVLSGSGGTQVNVSIQLQIGSGSAVSGTVEARR